MGRRGYAQEEVRAAEMIYDWLRRSGEIGKFGRSQEEIAAKSPVKNPERFKRALRYLSKKGLVINNHGS